MTAGESSSGGLSPYVHACRKTGSGCVVENNTMEVFGSALETTVNSGGWMYVSSGGMANETTLNNSGSMTIFNGGYYRTTLVDFLGRLRKFCNGPGVLPPP